MNPNKPLISDDEIDTTLDYNGSEYGAKIIRDRYESHLSTLTTENQSLKEKLEKAESENKNKFDQGFICACATTQKNHDCETIVIDTLVCNYMSIEDMRKAGVDEFDIEILEPLVKEIQRKKSLHS